jgi:aminoglycoside 2''-phosphotransferase
VERQSAEKKILKSYPDFVFKRIQKIGEGMDSVAFLVNGSHIFRFPKDAEVEKNLAKEIAVLPYLKTRLKVKIPQFDYIGANASFVGYRKIEGEFLSRELFYSFSEGEQNGIQRSLAEFLLTIHNQRIDDLKNSSLEAQDFQTEHALDFEKTKKYVFPLIMGEDRRFIENKFQSYLENDGNFAYKPVLLHNDLSADHIFVDVQTRQLNGIIDFGDIGIGDGDYDLMYLLDDYGEKFVRSFLKFYPHPNHEKLFQKLYFWGLVDILQLINHYSEEKNQSEIEDLLKHLRNWIDLIKSRKSS